ncbi:MAG: (2Fe-2S)-binding protein [Burkholderiales bacterium]|nr:(2Fe-2S)-binding protein [Burkholderiales bacterium]
MRGEALIRRARLASGLVLMAFVTCHLANLSLGLRSLAEMEAWRMLLTAPWTRGAGLWLLGAAGTIHLSLGLYAVAARRSLALSTTDVMQLALGLAIPPLAIAHVVATATANAVSPGFASNYGQILAVYWSFAPFYAFLQLFVVVFVWMHAAIGLYSWLVLKPVWRRIGGLVIPVLFAVPVLALLGFAQAGQEVLDKLASDPAWKQMILDNVGRIAKVTRELADFQRAAIWTYLAAVAAAFAILGARILRHRRRPLAVAYDGGARAGGRHGLSILEFSRLNDVPHAHVCSGRGRCGTCRVRVESGADRLSAPGDLERDTLARVHAGAGERLACQARVLDEGVAVTRLLPAFADASAARAPQEWPGGQAAAAAESRT